MAGTGRGPRPDSTTFTRRATDRFDGSDATARTDRPTDQYTDDATTE
jgi:hypothetical protein